VRPRQAGIGAIGTALGKRQLSVPELASFYNVSEAAVRRSVGANKIWVSEDEDEAALAERAVRSCLESAKLTPNAIDAIIVHGFCMAHSLKLQGQLGVTRATPLFLGGDCAELPTALFTAQTLIDGGAEHVLIASARRVPEKYRASGPLSEQSYRNVFSDGSGALLMSAQERFAFLGWASAPEPQYWEYWPKQHQFIEGKIPAEGLPHDLEILYETVHAIRDALHRCLDSVSLSPAQIDHVILPLDPEPLAHFFARHLGLSLERVVRDTRCSHMGLADEIFGLETLISGGKARPGEHVLVVARTVGITRFAVLRV
jgi:3-oxoacyl-[acyl-carrier-protein] synthase III